MVQFITDFIEKVIADFMSLSPGEKAFFSLAGIYLIVTTIWFLWIIYREKKESWLEEKRKKQSWKKILKSK